MTQMKPIDTNKNKTLSAENGINEANYSLPNPDSSMNTFVSFDLSNLPNKTLSDEVKQYHQTRIFVSGFDYMTHPRYGNTQSKGVDYQLCANLPDKFSYSFGSQWEQPLEAFGASGLSNAVMQFGASQALGENFASGVNRVQTIKIWKGSSPLTIQLSIPVLDDNSYDGMKLDKTNFRDAVNFLSCLSLPAKQGSLGFYRPPPSPLRGSISGFGHTLTLQNPYAYASTRIQIGGMFVLDKCIIENVDVSYDNTRSMIQHTDENGSVYLAPLFATINIKFSTIEAITSDTLGKMLWLDEQPDNGEFNTSLDEAMDAISDTVSNLGGLFGG